MGPTGRESSTLSTLSGQQPPSGTSLITEAGLTPADWAPSLERWRLNSRDPLRAKQGLMSDALSVPGLL